MTLSSIGRPARESFRSWTLDSLPRLFYGVGRWTFSLLFLPSALLSETTPPPTNRHVVVIVWDGMRPDFVTERHAPTLWKLAHEGVTFTRHHSVYPTATNVNGAAIATGVYPNRNSLLANREYRPQIDPGEWRQHLDITLVRDTVYIDKGNGAFTPTSSPSSSP